MTTPEALARGLESVGRGDVSLADALQMKRQVLDLMLDKAIGLATFGKHDQAELELSRLAALDGHSPFAPFALGALRAERRQFATAIEAYERAEERAARLGAAALEGRIALCRGHASMMVGDARRARAALTIASTKGDPQIAAEAAKLLKVME